MSDDDNWDEEFGIGSSSPPRKLSLAGDKRHNTLFRMDSGDGEEDWSNDFQPDTSTKQKILGIKADPNAKEEDWDDDFDFNNDNDKSLMPRGGLLRTRSTVHISDRAGVNQSLDEILFAIPAPKDVPKAAATKHETAPITITRRESTGDSEYWDSLVRQREQKVAKAKKDIVAQSRAYWELGRLYQTHNKLVNAMSEFQRALQLLEDERATSGSAPGAPTHQHYELELLFQLGLTAKEMADIFQQDYLERALVIAQTDRKFLQQYTQISLELGRAHMVSENPQMALRSFEAYLRSLIFGQHSPSQPVHTALEISRIDWRSVAVGCYQIGTTLRALAQEKGATAQDTLEYGELAREFLLKAEGLAEALGDKETKIQARSTLDRSALPTGGRRTSEPPSNAAIKDKLDALSPKKPEPEDDDEDWDKELGIEAEEDRPALAHLLVSTSKAKVERVPLKHRLFEAVSNQTFEIVKFPKPTFLYTLMTSSGHSFMHEEELESWLKNVLARHTKGETSSIAQHARDRLPFPELLSYYSNKIAKVSKGTKEWSILCVEFCYIIYLHGHLEFCLHSIHGFFDDLRNTVGTSRAHPVPEAERDVLFDHSFHLLYLASKLWKPEEDETFQRMMKVQRQLSAQHSYLVDVLAAETYSHHLYHHTTSSNEEDDDDDDDVDEDEGELSDGPDSTPSWNTHKPSANGAEHESFEEARANPLLALCKTYTKCKHIRNSHSAKPDEKQRAQIACARALVAIHLHMHGISPLTTARLSSKENLHAVLAKAISEGDKEYAEAIQPSSRMRIVEEIYPVLPAGFLKAKAAFALAHHHKEFLGKPAQAERMYFEAIYILDQCKVFPVGLPPILSELGKNALLGYADVLITNYKYQYGILCYEAALENLYLRGKMSAREYPSLLRRVAAISRDNHDMRRAVVLYKDILHSYCAENKINEVIFVSETLASIHLERGDFALAESYLLAASLALRRNSPQTDRMDPMYFDLQLKQMAPLYLDSFHFERGIELLDRLSVGELSHEKRNRLLADLAGAYIKKEWFDECTQILGRLEVEERQAHVSAEIAKMGGSGKHPLPSVTKQMSPVGSAGKLSGSKGHSSPSPPQSLSSASSFPLMGSVQSSSSLGGSAGSAGSSRLDKTLKYCELLTRNCYHSGRSQEAMAAIELAIDICPVSSLFARGHYYYMRGKVLQSLCSSSSTITLHFPTSLKPPVYDQANMPSDSTIYTCTGDIVQEAAASYKKAYQYFKSIGDDVRIAKTVCRIAETYLERVFGPVALLHYPYEDLARLPAFALSSLVAKDETEADKRKREPLKRRSRAELPHPDVKEFYISFEMIENPATLAIDICADTFDVMLMLKAHMNMAELRYLQGDTETALAHWNECKNEFLTLFFTGPHLLAPGPPHVIKRMLALAKRMTRFLFCLPHDIINNNLTVIDAYLHLQLELEAALKRTIQPSKAMNMEIQGSMGTSLVESLSLAGLGAGTAASIQQVADAFSPIMPSSKPAPPTAKKSAQQRASLSMAPLGGSGAALPSLTTVVRKGRTNPKRGTASGLFDLPDDVGSQSMSPTSPRHEASSMVLTTEDAHAAVNNANIAEKIWGHLYCMKQQIKKYSAGKIALDELQSRNQATLKRILKFVQPRRPTNPTSSPSSSPFLSSGSSSSSFSASTTSLPTTTPDSYTAHAIPRLLYVLQLDNFVVYYTPKTGHKLINRLGGNEELNPQQPPQSLIFLQIHLFGESVTFLVHPFITPERILSHLVTKQYWYSTESSNKRKTFFGSFSRGSSNSIKTNPRFVDRTRDFHRELTRLLANLGFSPDTSLHTSTSGSSMSSSPSSNFDDPLTTSSSFESDMASSPLGTSPSSSNNLIYEHFGKRTEPAAAASAAVLKALSFAKKTVRGAFDHSVGYMPITNQMDAHIYKIFSKREMRDCTEQTPVHLYLFGTDPQSSMKLGGLSNSAKLNRGSLTLTTPIRAHAEPIALTQEMIELLTNQLALHTTKDSQEVTDEYKKVIGEMANAVVGVAKEILPSLTEQEQDVPNVPSAKSRSLFPFFSNKNESKTSIRPVSSSPLTLICSHAFQIFPWELLIPNEVIVRYISLWDAIKHLQINLPEEKGASTIFPQFIGVYHSQGEKTVAQLDASRRDTMSQHILHELRINPQPPSSLHAACNPFPFHTPLIKLGKKSGPYKRKYKYMDFVDLSDPLQDLSKFVDAASTNYPIFLLTFADLLGSSQMVQHILRSSKCPVIFVPGGKMKAITTKLVKMQELYIKQHTKALSSFSRKDRYQYLMAMMTFLQEETTAPIVVFNPPIV